MAVDEYVGDIAEGFDDLREELWGADATITLLRVSGRNAPYTVLGQVEGGWATTQLTPSAMALRIADLSADLGALIRQASHLIFEGTVIDAVNGVVWEVRTGTAPPLGTRPWWLLRLLSTGRVFTPPSTEL